MLYWLIQTLADHPALARAEAPEGLLSSIEEVRLRSLIREKRRRDWLLGRWTAKRLAAFYVERVTGRRPELSDILITTDPDGAPRLHGRNGYAFIIDRLAISISHSRDHAFCALIAVPGYAPGADIEYVEPRDPGFVTDFFADPEIAYVHHAPPSARPLLTTVIWSAKEAALKSLRCGLTVDTRWIVCLPDEPTVDGWAPVLVQCHPELNATVHRGWWRQMGRFVLTLATATTDRGFSINAGDTVAEARRIEDGVSP
ncbi:MAG: 4'-phosphopantetheinyl transferase superfamily protein [Roseiflexus sp.]|nr:4'-phosphopantetheinyl transferase superfamily protein [Roseiflexus sp.]MCS7290226.1 4'-phosphopantetheinyl transferase superfamily protein [Roseiflexus sp.]MDW8146605.1 4'-phosphopantetheinyl transferase superfamily protein [Roseiflexaceae bacterium]MDW8233627.1 4'-phosphopantetheinyl transferase superfamily protein [Roseiflexaceae bacterium]